MIFGRQRQRGCAHDNPNVQEIHKTQALQMVDLFCNDPVKGNGCKRKISQIDLDKENFPLPKQNSDRQPFL